MPVEHKKSAQVEQHEREQMKRELVGQNATVLADKLYESIVRNLGEAKAREIWLKVMNND